MVEIQFKSAPEKVVEKAYQYVNGEYDGEGEVTVEEGEGSQIEIRWTETVPDDPEDFDPTNIDATNRTTTELRETVATEKQIRSEVEDGGDENSE